MRILKVGRWYVSPFVRQSVVNPRVKSRCFDFNFTGLCLSCLECIPELLYVKIKSTLLLYLNTCFLLKTSASRKEWVRPLAWCCFDFHSWNLRTQMTWFFIWTRYLLLWRQTLQTTCCQRIQVAGEPCSWPSRMWRCLVKDGVLQITQQKHKVHQCLPLGGVRRGVGRGHMGSNSQSKLRPPGQFPTSGLKVLGGWYLPGPQVSKKRPLDSSHCGPGVMWQAQQLPFWGREGRGSTKEADLGYLP